MVEIGRREIGINSFAIRIVAVLAMFLAAFGKAYGYKYAWMEYLGWTSFTLFAFLLAEGVAHSSGKWRYLRRVVFFSIFSEVAYDYWRFHKFFVLRYSSVMMTILLGLLVLCILSFVKSRYQNMVLDMILIAVLGFGSYLLSNIFNFAYGGYGIIIILMFYVAREVTYSKITQVIVLFYICFYLTSNVFTHVSIFGLQYPIAPELFSFIALPFIWLYDDNRGPNALGLQVAAYMMYPLTMLMMIYVKYFYNS